jgi:nucleoside 2-deoxyribosyltransferase
VVRTGSVGDAAAVGNVVYLAGPSGFFEAGLLWHNTVVVPKVLEAGLVPMDPWSDQTALTVAASTDEGPERLVALASASLVQGRRDLAMIDESQVILASLDGQDVDSGTALELGYGFAKGLLLVGVRTDIRLCSDTEGGVVNLMISTCIVDSGGIITDSLDTAIAFIVDRVTVSNS